MKTDAQIPRKIWQIDTDRLTDWHPDGPTDHELTIKTIKQ